MQEIDDTGQEPTEATRTIIVAPARTHAVPFEEKQRRTSELLGWNDSILAGQVSPSTRKQYTEDFFDYLRFAKSAQGALDSAIFSQWRTDLVERIYLVPDRDSPGEMVEKQLSPNTINRMLAAVRHMLMEAEEKKLVPRARSSSSTACAVFPSRGSKTASSRTHACGSPRRRCACSPSSQ